MAERQGCLIIDSFDWWAYRIPISCWSTIWTCHIRTTPNCWSWPACRYGPNGKNGAKTNSSRNSDRCVITTWHLISRIDCTCYWFSCFFLSSNSFKPRRTESEQRAGSFCKSVLIFRCSCPNGHPSLVGRGNRLCQSDGWLAAAFPWRKKNTREREKEKEK